MSTFRFFYTDYCEDKSIPAEEAWLRSTDEILHSMDCVLHLPNNFCGIIDSKETTLQFMVNDDRSVDIDIPIPAKGGSYTKTATLKECLAHVRTLGDTIERESIAGLSFNMW